MNIIDSFEGDYHFLSNFHEHGWTVEHYFQAAKTDSPEWRQKILDAVSPRIAKKLGRNAPMRSTWDTEKFEVMRGLLANKFAKGTDLAQQLTTTGDSLLIEGNWWGDRIWGVCEGTGENMLGIMLMERRGLLRLGGA